jgi:hypothetical protein
MLKSFSDQANETVERLRRKGGQVSYDAADLIERLMDRINHLTDLNEDKSEMIAELRVGLSELRQMCAPLPPEPSSSPRKHNPDCGAERAA